MRKDLSFLVNNIIAHRGYHDITKGIPENSILAFKRAIEHNYIIELDVHVLKDRNVIVFHDDNLKRMTGIDMKVSKLTYSELSNITLNKTNQKIPTLEEVLSLIDGKVPVIIELKYDVKCGILERQVIEILKKYNGKYVVKSFNPLSIIYFRMHYPQAVRGQLVSNFTYDKISLLKKCILKNMLLNFLSKPDFISCDIRRLQNNKIIRLRKRMKVLGWTIRTKEEYEKYKEFCDNVICENIEEL